MSLTTLPSEILLDIASCLERLHDTGALVRTNRHLYKCLNLRLYHLDVEYVFVDTWAHYRSTFDEFDIQSVLDEWPVEGLYLEIYVQNRQTRINNPLYFAIRWGHIEIAHLFLKYKPSEWNWSPNERGVLQEAVRYNRLSVLQLMIDQGMDVNVNRSLENFRDYTPLHLACWCGHVEIVELLLDSGADMEVADCFNRRPMDWAVLPEANGYSGWGPRGGLVEMVQIVKLLLDHGAKPEKRGWKRYFQNCMFDYPEVDLSCLLESAPADNGDTSGQAKKLVPRRSKVEHALLMASRICKDCGWTFSARIQAPFQSGSADRETKRLPDSVPETFGKAASASISRCTWCRRARLRYWIYAEGTGCWPKGGDGRLIPWGLSEDERIGGLEKPHGS